MWHFAPWRLWKFVSRRNQVLLEDWAMDSQSLLKLKEPRGTISWYIPLLCDLIWVEWLILCPCFDIHRLYKGLVPLWGRQIPCKNSIFSFLVILVLMHLDVDCSHYACKLMVWSGSSADILHYLCCQSTKCVLLSFHNLRWFFWNLYYFIPHIYSLYLAEKIVCLTLDNGDIIWLPEYQLIDGTQWRNYSGSLFTEELSFTNHSIYWNVLKA